MYVACEVKKRYVLVGKDGFLRFCIFSCASEPSESDTSDRHFY